MRILAIWDVSSVRRKSHPPIEHLKCWPFDHCFSRRGTAQKVVRHWNNLHKKSCECLIPGGVKNQVGWGPGQNSLVGGVSDHSKWVGTR